MANKLDKEILVGDESYQVTAVHSDTADKVSNKLTINVAGPDNTTEAVEFNGEEEKVVNVVSTSGGTYTGQVKMEVEPTDITTTADNNNYYLTTVGAVKELVKDLDTQPLLTWANGELSTINGSGGSYPTGIKFVTGSTSDLGTFYTEVESTNAYYIYLGFDNAGNLVTFLVVPGNSPICIGTRQLTQVGAESGQNQSLTYDSITGKFDDLEKSINLITNNTSETSESNPGLSQLDTAIKNLTSDNSTAHAGFGTRLTTIETDIRYIKDGTTTVGKATNASNAVSATKATQDSNGNTIHTNYYKSNSNTTEVNSIYIKTSDPTTATGSDATLANNAKVGDIWIVYKTN